MQNEIKGIRSRLYQTVIDNRKTTTEIRTQINFLNNNMNITEISNLTQVILADLLQIVSANESNVGSDLQDAFGTIFDAVNAINNAVINAIPLLNNIVTALTQILQRCIHLVGQFVKLVLKVLGSVTNTVKPLFVNTPP
ncbi:unnamed protein product [Rotaria sp. Silwood2]|nr:unnamed protein product [Rotaria sp. Silwood2]